MPNTRGHYKKRRSKRLQSGHRDGNNRKKQQQQQQSSCYDIEQQLQKQRRKRSLQQEEEQQDESAPPPPPRVLGDYRYDPVQKAYFPKNTPTSRASSSSSKKKRKDIQNADSRLSSWHHLFSPNGIPSCSVHSLLYAAETCPVASRNYKVRSWCALRQMLHGAEVVSTNRQTKSGNWTSMLSPYCDTPCNSDEQDEPSDLICKSRLAPSATTFDVSPGMNKTMMPAFISLVDGGCMLRLQAPGQAWDLDEERETYPHLDGFVFNEHSAFFPAGFQRNQHDDFDAIKFQVRNDKLFDNDNYLFGAISNSNDSKFHLFATDEPRCVTTLPRPVNDFSLSIAGTIDPNSLAFAPQKRHRNEEISPLFYSFDHQCSFSRRTRFFPQSDVMCVEHMLYDFPSSGNVILYGHRNGQVSMLDSRCGNCVSVIGNPKELSRDFGSVSRILSATGHSTLLTKGSFGECHVYDLRAMGGRYSVSSSLRLTLSPPCGEFSKTLSSHCSGIAMDLTGFVAMYPYATKDREPRLGMWCLDTGTMVGSKQLRMSPSTSRAMPYCELSNTITNAYEMSEAGVGRRRGSFGLWLKCGQVQPNAPPSKAGSIHHVTFPGDARRVKQSVAVEMDVNSY